MTWKQTLLSRRPNARAYAESLEALSTSIVGRTGTIGAIAIAPVKSFQMLTLSMHTPEDGARVGRFGLTTPDALVADRQYALASWKDGQTNEDVAYNLVRWSQREEPNLAKIQPLYEAGFLTYRVGDRGCRELPPFEPYGPPKRMLMSAQTQELCMVEVDRGRLDKWMHAILETAGIPSKDLAMVRVAKGYDRLVRPCQPCGMESATLLSDGGQVTIASRSTIDWMNAERAKKDVHAYRIDIRQFRMNITLEGLPPNAEDLIEEIVIGPARVPLNFGDLSDRCSMTRHAPDTGVLLGKDPLAYLAKERPPRPDLLNSTTFGVNCVFPPGAIGQVIRSGMTFEVTKEK